MYNLRVKIIISQNPFYMWSSLPIKFNYHVFQCMQHILILKYKSVCNEMLIELVLAGNSESSWPIFVMIYYIVTSNLYSSLWNSALNTDRHLLLLLYIPNIKRTLSPWKQTKQIYTIRNWEQFYTLWTSNTCIISWCSTY